MWPPLHITIQAIFLWRLIGLWKNLGQLSVVSPWLTTYLFLQTRSLCFLEWWIHDSICEVTVSNLVSHKNLWSQIGVSLFIKLAWCFCQHRKKIKKLFALPQVKLSSFPSHWICLQCVGIFLSGYSGSSRTMNFTFSYFKTDLFTQIEMQRKCTRFRISLFCNFIPYSRFLV